MRQRPVHVLIDALMLGIENAVRRREEKINELNAATDENKTMSQDASTFELDFCIAPIKRRMKREKKLHKCTFSNLREKPSGYGWQTALNIQRMSILKNIASFLNMYEQERIDFFFLFFQRSPTWPKVRNAPVPGFGGASFQYSFIMSFTYIGSCAY